MLRDKKRVKQSKEKKDNWIQRNFLGCKNERVFTQDSTKWVYHKNGKERNNKRMKQWI